MRTRKEIMDGLLGVDGLEVKDDLDIIDIQIEILDVLLDVRDLLTFIDATGRNKSCHNHNVPTRLL